jgi:tetratricopeptide (TPR) repeat protein
MGNYQKALGLLKKSIDINPDDPGNYYNMVCYYSLQENIDEALIWLEKTLEKGYDNWEHLVEDTDLDNIRNLEKYKVLINKYKNQN